MRTDLNADRALDSIEPQAPHAESPGLLEPSFVDALIEPSRIFRTPEEVVEHPWFSDAEKRVILTSWVRDELVNEQLAAQALPELTRRSPIEALIEALALFDASAAGEYLSATASVRAAGSPPPKKR